MLENLIRLLFRDLSLDRANHSIHNGVHWLKISECDIQLKDWGKGVYISANLCPNPELNREEFFLLLMEANFLCQGTGGSVLGLNEDEDFIVLSYMFPYDLNYAVFKDKLETFVNFTEFWKNRILEEPNFRRKR